MMAEVEGQIHESRLEWLSWCQCEALLLEGTMFEVPVEAEGWKKVCYSFVLGT